MKQALIPPFDLTSAAAKVQRAEDLWNEQNPSKVALAYSEDSQWRNRDHFVTGRLEIELFLTKKWQKERHYRLQKKLFCFADNRIAVDFQYEYQAEDGQWHRAYGLEHWQFDSAGLMTHREASINEIQIAVTDRTLF
ncbi:nuclear transport factor 2 family protein [Pseudoalteromonas tunicata]|jgi:nuclear transport factor 2 (NTF2) superfamily protein|uniref:DUF4440 domain-containing protein n=1 Tax=Pseudoalteromonas tunicata D2 TaxID=87626 RepID=A4CDU3_9GAMM|nr:nuclear transport factor 2 family protein [Pseudoalteromonas tunicata]ATC96372.1 hypothetical protein PTUN_a4160 [Pseudoalteromonas tunicata]AXT31867.1 nuclear transport factor 2 family protein [Pseudoalteromonas tunicata]EAR27135.1 hypothetical protein PTD2_05675 [Pseudoalteromonas tunicata D2]